MKASLWGTCVAMLLGQSLYAEEILENFVTAPIWSTSTVAGKFEWKENLEEGRCRVFLAGKEIDQSDDAPQLMKRFNPGIPPFDEILVLDYFPRGSTFADHGPIRFLSLKKNGEYRLSSAASDGAAGKTFIKKEGNRIILTFPENPNDKHGPFQSETWIYEKGEVSHVSP